MLCCLLAVYAAAGCQTLRSADEAAAAQKIIGVWEYEWRGETWRREFTEDRRCIATRAQDGKLMWDCDYIVDEAGTVIALQNHFDTVMQDGRLNIDNAVVARRVPTKAASSCDGIVGVWEYRYKGTFWRREFTEDGRCIVRRASDGKVQWERPYTTVDDKTANVVLPLSHRFVGDDVLDVQGLFLARRAA